MKMKLACMIMIKLIIFSLAGTGLAGESIKIGTPLALTGPYAGDGVSYFRGIKMAVDEINEAGGLLGRQIEIVKFDTQDFAPERVMQAADTLIRSERVHVLHAGWAGWGQDVRAYGKYNVPTFVFNGSLNSVLVYRSNKKKYSNWFHLTDIEKNFSIDEAFVMKNLPYEFPNRKLAIIATDDSWGTEIAKGLVDNAKDAGWEVVMKEVVPYGTMKWEPLLTKIRRLKPGWIKVEIASAPESNAFLRQFLKSPTQSLLHLGYGAVLEDFLSNSGKEAEGVIASNALAIPEPYPTPEAEAWVNNYIKRFGSSPRTNSLPVYTGVKFWAEAVEKVGKVDDYEAINAYVANNKFKTVEGRMIQFDEDHKIPVTSWPGNTMQVQDGKLVTLFLSAKDRKNPTPYKTNKFHIPPWIKR